MAMMGFSSIDVFAEPLSEEYYYEVQVPARIALSSSDFKNFTNWDHDTIDVSLTTDNPAVHVYVEPATPTFNITNASGDTASMGVTMETQDFTISDMEGSGDIKTKDEPIIIAGQLSKLGDYVGDFVVNIWADITYKDSPPLDIDILRRLGYDVSVDIATDVMTVKKDGSVVTSLDIPRTYAYEGDGYVIRSVGGMAFFKCESLSEIILPDSVTTIGEKSFSGCYNMLSFEIPEDIESIGDQAFWNSCGSIKYDGTWYEDDVMLNAKLIEDGVATGDVWKRIDISSAIRFESADDFTLKANSGKTWNGMLEYSVDGCQTFTEWNGEEISVDGGNRLYIRGTGNTVITGNSFANNWVMTGSNVECHGNIENLLDYQTVANGEHPTMGDYCYAYMFYRGASLAIAPELPATTLTENCYYQMFYGCTSLTIAPELPARTLADSCYSYMFYGCTSLVTAPELPATTLADNCYESMFSGCTLLAKAPELSAENLRYECYRGMFSGCTSLTKAPELPSTYMHDNSYRDMFSGCTSLTEVPTILPATHLGSECYRGMFKNCTSLTKAPKLPATSLVEYCYCEMFGGCTSLTEAPELPAETLPSNGCCYMRMFKGCESLAVAPDLPANNISRWCYAEMFSGCSSLLVPPELPAKTLYEGCYDSMFENCTSLTRLPDLNATKLVNRAYTSIFNGCSSISLSETPTDECMCEYRVPMIGTIDATGVANNYGTSMFANTHGPFTGKFELNKTYYTNGIPVPGNYSITYDLDGGSMSGQKTVYNSETDTFTLPTPTKDGYEFVGWSGTGLTGSSNKTVTVAKGSTGNRSYTANWGISLESSALKFSSDSNFTLRASVTWNGKIEYFNNGNWITWYGDQLSGSATQPIYLRGTRNSKITAENRPWTFTGKYCTGNIENLLDYRTVANGEHPVMAEKCYCDMFEGCTSLITAPELPATTLTNTCYYSMFEGCTKLTTAPALPATTMAGGCYFRMFSGCTSLTTVPALPATTMAENCYYCMFNNCTSLTTVPVLPATTLVRGCYESMFYGCTSLKLSDTKTGDYQYAYRIPMTGTGTTGTGTTVTNALKNMFTNTGGPIAITGGTPTINRRFYTTNPPVK